MWNVEDPTAKFEIGSAKSSGELLRPFRRSSIVPGGLQKRNRPRRKNSEHANNANEMRRVKERAPVPFLARNRNHETVEKQEMHRSFGEPAESEKNERHSPDQPRRSFLEPEAQPKNDRERVKGNVKPFDLDQPAFFDDPGVNEPHQRRDCRSTRAQTRARDGHERDRHEQNAQYRRRSSGPFVLPSKNFE